MSKPRVLIVSQEISPYLPKNELSLKGRNLPQGIQERGKEIRTFMPRFGSINERRHQLHEVIRLSGMNLVVNDTDHPLIIKVASIQPARMQVYFIDNEEYFQRKAIFEDEDGHAFEDNDERAIFFAKGVIETVRKLGWSPDVIHCHGWMTSLLPLYVRTYYKDDPLFEGTKIVYSAYNNKPDGELDNDLRKKIEFDGIKEDVLSLIDESKYHNLQKIGVAFSDASIVGQEDLDEGVCEYIRGSEKPFLESQSEEEYIDAYNGLYDQVLEDKTVLAD